MKVLGGSINKITNTIISLCCLSLFIYNLFNQLSLGKDVVLRIHYTLPFLILSLVGLFLKTPIYLESVVLVASIGMTITIADRGSLWGVILFSLSYLFSKNNINFILVIFIMTISVFFKSYTHSISLVNTFAITIGYLGFLFIVKNVSTTKKLPKLNKEESKMLELLSKGDSQKTAGAKLGMDKSQANYCVKNIRTKCDCNTIYEVLYLYGRANS